MGIGTNIDQPVLRNILQKAMDNLEPAAVAELRQQWLGSRSATTTVEFTEEERQWIADNPVIRVHNTMNWRPFNFNENGLPAGYFIDHMDLIASKTGLQVDYVSGPTWQEFLNMIQSGDLDVMLNIAPTTERATYIHFTEPHLQMPSAIVVNDTESQVQSLQDLHGKRVAVAEGNFQQDLLARDHPEIELVLQDDTLRALYAVVEGRAEAMIDDYAAVDYMINDNALTGLRVALIARDSDYISLSALGVRFDAPILRDILQKGMDSLEPAVVADLRQQWLGSAPTTTAVSSEVGLTQEELQWLAAHPVIRMGVFPTGATFDFVDDNGVHRGFTADMLALALPRAGLNVERVPDYGGHAGAGIAAGRSQRGAGSRPDLGPGC
jgi:ABC-type amino acid transport substrate-binding protein